MIMSAVIDSFIYLLISINDVYKPSKSQFAQHELKQSIIIFND